MDKDRMMNMFLELCRVPSISESAGEAAMPVKLREMLGRINYFIKHPENITVHEIQKDPLKRSYIFAFLEGSPGCADTVILLSHFDVVDVEEYGVHKAMAFDPKRFTDFLKNSGAVELPADAKTDLDSGDYLFGRGTMDMKYGIAAGMEVLYQLEDKAGKLPVNVLFVSVPDEESNSYGMLAAVNELLNLKEKKNLKYICCLVTEPYFPQYPGDVNRYMYVAAAGKLMPIFYCVGKETHAGEPFSGLNPNVMTAAVVEQIEQNPELADACSGEFGPAPTCLKQSDTKEAYSVKTPAAAYAYFNLITLSTTPEEAIAKMKEEALKAFKKVLAERDKKAARMSERTGRKLEVPVLEPKVYTYKEVYELCRQKHGEAFEEHMKRFITGADIRDLRSLSVEAVKEVHRFCPDRSPMIILFLVPPYYPHNDIPAEDSLVMKVCGDIIKEAAEKYGETIYIDPFFKGITDMCYLRLPEKLDIKAVKENYPLWGMGYSVPLEEITKLNIPFINLGPMGKDAHKFTERINISYSFGTAAELIFKTVLLLGGIRQD